MEEHVAIDPQSVELDRHKGNRAGQKRQYVEEPTRDVLGHNDGAMLVARVAPSLDVPVLDTADDVRFVRWTKHELDFVTRRVVGVSQQEIETPRPLLLPLSRDQFDFAEAEDARVLRDAILHPPL